MKSSVLFLILLFSIINSMAFAAEKKHYVFLVHGIGASATTFGEMKKTLKDEAKGFDPHTDWQFIDFGYQTGNDSKDVMIFARELGDIIVEEFNKKGGLQSDDKFSLVMHSQGGLIGLNFLLKAFANDKNYHPELQHHLDAFVSMGTPYWGAKIAIFANRMMPILSYLRIPLSEKLGDHELRDMELASDFSAEMRETLINPDNKELLDRIKSQGRFLVFSGVTERLNILAPFVTGKNRYEDDTAVPIPSSRLDFIYYSDSKDAHMRDVKEADFKKTDFIDDDNYVVVNAFHASPFPQKTKFPGIAKVPERCGDISYLDCDHPTYPMLVEHLFKLERRPAFIRDLTSFAIDLKLKTNGYTVDKKKMSISFKSLSTGLKVDKDVELYNKVSRWSDRGDFRMYHTGYIDSKKTSSTVGKVEMVISIPGFKDRKIVVPVRTALSTFVELELEK